MSALKIHVREVCDSHEIPTVEAPSFNVIKGDSQAGNKLAMQGSMVFPAVVSSLLEAMIIGAEVYQNPKKVIKEK
ncbi:hypothetical protein U0070_025007 [Myodes glareolus]|uniref:phosphopyruvate hydratase n=1 Tax=Myodes glareolus TaxID=447135 RepID=A0AAW0I0M7_MYOGA